MNIIYQYTSPSGKSYIGKTTEAREARRRYEHRLDADKGSSTAFHNAIRKYGIESFDYKVILCGVPSEIVSGMEIICIDLYKPEYNITKGGDGVDSDTARINALRRWADPEDSACMKASMKGKKKTITEAWKKASSIKTAKRNSVCNSIEYTCPNCSKTGKGPNMKRYHFDNCKGKK